MGGGALASSLAAEVAAGVQMYFTDF